jgi:hypothetical protein
MLEREHSNPCVSATGWVRRQIVCQDRLVEASRHLQFRSRRKP